MQSEEIRKRFLAFFEKRGHSIIPSASLIPENDPSVLFTTAGMQPLVPYLLGEKHALGKRVVDVQKCVRTGDIDEVGDNTHLTFFEMLGNWSFGDYFKDDAIKWSFELLTNGDDKEEGSKGFGLDPSRLYITVFEGDENAPKDDKSFEIWKEVGIPENHIYFMSTKTNWWSTGDNGPCGPDTEMYYDITKEGLNLTNKEDFIKADKEQKVVEIWNDVFMEYEKKDGKIIGKLKNKNVDTGAGLERLTTVLQNKESVYDTDAFEYLFKAIDNLNPKNNSILNKRIIADHIRTIVFMIGDGVIPSNIERGYVLRKLLRRAVRYSDLLGLLENSLQTLVYPIANKYKDSYPYLEAMLKDIETTIGTEEIKFRQTLGKGLKIIKNLFQKEDNIVSFALNDDTLFDLYQTYGFPVELSLEEINRERIDRGQASVDQDLKEKYLSRFQKKFEEHQKLSQTASAGMFKGGLAGTGEKETKYHTATHMLNAALREVLGTHVSQKGSNITAERMRYDFSHSQKMTEEEKKKVEDIVNKNIENALNVSFEEMSPDEAKKSGALGVFGDKYGDKVKVYTIGNDTSKESKSYFSREICGGPHVSNTKELGHFKIIKEEAVSAGVRRIKAILE